MGAFDEQKHVQSEADGKQKAVVFFIVVSERIEHVLFECEDRVNKGVMGDVYQREREREREKGVFEQIQSYASRQRRARLDLSKIVKLDI